MKDVLKFLTTYGNLIIIILLLLILLKTCGISRTQTSMKKEFTKDITNLDSAIRKDIKIDGLQISKRILYDWNTVIRTTNRPDDIMNKYDQEIKELQSGK